MKCEVEVTIKPNFYDVQLKQYKKYGDTYIVDKERADDLVAKKLVRIVKNVEEEKKEEAKIEENATNIEQDADVSLGRIRRKRNRR